MSDNIIPGIDPSAVQAKLKEVITQAAEAGLLDVIDWPSHPLPQELLREEQNRRSTNVYSLSNVQASLPSPGLPHATKKRKSSESADAAVPPWRQKGLADRIGALNKTDHPDKRQKKIEAFRAGAPSSKFNDLEARKQRFHLDGPASPFYSSSRDDSPLPDDGPVVGTSQKLEKNYFRLTAPPKPETVRPLPVLKQTIELLIRKWKEEHNYGYICDQFKSMRQDLTVQHIKTDFTVRVYEAHARIALEKGDLGEYNQCQTQLRALYKQKLGGCPGEFMAYRIFYFIHTCNRTGMNDVLADLTAADKHHPAVDHALQVRSALAVGNYHRFFKLYDNCPNMGGYLMDIFVDRERIAALASVCRS